MFAHALESSLDFLQRHPLVKNSKVVKYYWDHLKNFQGFYYDHRKFVNAIAIENTTACNRTCPYCPHFWQKRPRNSMGEALLYKIAEDLSDLNYRGTIIFAPFGEPLLDDRLPYFVEHIKKKMRGCTVTILTNGDLLTVERFHRLDGSGVDCFAVSDHFDIQDDRYVIADPKAAIETFLVLDQSDRKKMNFYDSNYERIKRLERFHDRCGLVVLEDNVSQEKLFKTCEFPESIMTISYNGDVLLCGRQWTSVPLFGNVAKEHVKDVWKKRPFRRIRKNLRKGVFELELCKNCGHGYMPDPAQLKELKASHAIRPSSGRRGEVKAAKVFGL